MCPGHRLPHRNRCRSFLPIVFRQDRNYVIFSPPKKSKQPSQQRIRLAIRTCGDLLFAFPLLAQLSVNLLPPSPVNFTLLVQHLRCNCRRIGLAACSQRRPSLPQRANESEMECKPLVRRVERKRRNQVKRQCHRQCHDNHRPRQIQEMDHRIRHQPSAQPRNR